MIIPNLKPYAKLLSDAEKMVVLSPNRMIWGALLGVFATPLVLAGFWQVYQGLAGANETLVLTAVLLFGIASVIGAFVHGTFYYMGEYVQALNKVDEYSQVYHCRYDHSPPQSVDHSPTRLFSSSSSSHPFCFQ